MSRSKEIFLGRKGRVFGPFTPAEFEEMSASGKIDQYHWIWDEPASAWKPLDPAPMPLSRGKSRGDAPIIRASAAAVEGLEVLCFDGRGVLEARLEAATETGCTIVCESDDGGPAFAGEANVGINLLDAGEGRSITVQGRLQRVTYEGGRWIYRFRWESSPLEQLAAA